MIKTRKYLKILFLLIAVFLITSITIYAHPGRTDSYGGHYDNETGRYHYHHGYSAHKHTNGVCPYGYDNKTSHNYGSSYSNADRKPKLRLETREPDALKLSECPKKNSNETDSFKNENAYNKYIVILFIILLIVIINVKMDKYSRLSNIKNKLTLITSEYQLCFQKFYELKYKVNYIRDDFCITGNKLVNTGKIYDEKFYIATRGKKYHQTYGCSNARRSIDFYKDRYIFDRREACYKCILQSTRYCLPYEYYYSQDIIKQCADISQSIKEISNMLNELINTLETKKYRSLQKRIDFMAFKRKTNKEIYDILESIKTLETAYYGNISRYSVYSKENINKTFLPVIIVDETDGTFYTDSRYREKLPKNFMKYIGSDGIIYIKKYIKNDKTHYVQITFEQFERLKK